MRNRSTNRTITRDGFLCRLDRPEFVRMDRVALLARLGVSRHDSNWVCRAFAFEGWSSLPWHSSGNWHWNSAAQVSLF
jgi:hypothetical protein